MSLTAISSSSCLVVRRTSWDLSCQPESYIIHHRHNHHHHHQQQQQQQQLHCFALHQHIKQSNSQELQSVTTSYNASFTTSSGPKLKLAHHKYSEFKFRLIQKLHSINPMYYRPILKCLVRKSHLHIPRKNHHQLAK